MTTQEKPIVSNKIIIISIITLIVIIIATTTFAWQTWSSGEESNSISLKIKDLVDVIFDNGTQINVTDLEPILDYNDGATTTFSIKKITSSNIILTATLDITSISNDLKEESFKYILLSSTDNNNFNPIASGNFVEAGTNLIILDNYTLTEAKTYYKFIIYIDGNMKNPLTLQGKTLEGILNVNASKVS